jgi:hypothetical protein
MRATAQHCFLLSWLVFIFACVQKQPPADPTAEIKRVLRSSERLQKLLAEAKSGTQYRIDFVALPQGDTSYLGLTTLNEGDDRNGVTVHIAPGLSDQLTENLLAHELFHILLDRQGFPTDTQAPTLVLQQANAVQSAILKAVGLGLTNCYADARIDELMSARGFSPKVINRREADLKVEQGRKTQTPPPIQNFALWTKYASLSAFCLSIRARDFEMKEVFDAWKRGYPTLEADVAQLGQKGPRRCEDAPSCIEATRTLRSAAGFDGIVWFYDPLTQGWK